MKRGLIGKENNTENAYKQLLNYGTNLFYTELTDLLNSLEPNDKIVIYDITDLNISIKQFVNQISEFKNQNITIQIIDSFTISLDTYLDVLLSGIEIQQGWITSTTRKGIEKAKDNGKIVGRPRLSEDKVNEISSLYNQKLTIREISEKVDVSLGTVHKYIARFKEEQNKNIIKEQKDEDND